MLDVVRCPYCGGRLELVTSMFFQEQGDHIAEGILGCHCCIFPVVDGIPVLHLHAAAVAARDHVEAGRPKEALRAMIGLAGEAQAEAFEAAIASDASTYRDVVAAMGPAFEGGYFLYRFSDPTFLVADAVVRAVGATVLAGGLRAVDICGGSGHLTRTLLDLSAAPPVLADLYFAKLWLARRFTAPGCEPVCCDGNAPMPFARSAFALAMCSDAFQYIWTKRQFVAEMLRLIGLPPAPGSGGGPTLAGGSAAGAVLISHTHNARTWSPSHGQPLSPGGYAALFEGATPRLFAEGLLFEDVVQGGGLDLARRHPPEALDADPAITIVSTNHPDVFRRHASAAPRLRGELRINPLYVVSADGDALRLRLRFPSPDYEDEYGACRRYLPDEAVVSARAVQAANDDRSVGGDLADLVRRRVLVDLPDRYY
jgi:uncharacterized protein YbaR (Trm112 family)